MVNHPKRAAEKPYIAFSTITHQALAWGKTAQEARDRIVTANKLDDGFIEVLACGTGGRKIWSEQVSLAKARGLNLTVFRGAGDEPHVPTIPLVED